MKKVMKDRVLWSLALCSHVVRTVKDTAALHTGNIQLSVVEDSFPETALNIINDFPQLKTKKIILPFYLLLQS